MKRGYALPRYTWLTALLIAGILTCVRAPVHAQSIMLGAGSSGASTADANGAFDFVVTVSPLKRIEIRLSRGRATDRRSDVTCGFADVPSCNAEPVNTTGVVQSIFAGTGIPLKKWHQFETVLVPELGFARLDGTRKGQTSGRFVTARGDYLGIGVRAQLKWRATRTDGLFAMLEVGQRALLNATIGESLDRYDPYRESTTVRLGAIGIGYSF